jgi:hypothetical protein
MSRERESVLCAAARCRAAKQGLRTYRKPPEGVRVGMRLLEHLTYGMRPVRVERVEGPGTDGVWRFHHRDEGRGYPPVHIVYGYMLADVED